MNDVSLERPPFWAQPAAAMFALLGTTANGYNRKSAARKLAESGPNTLSYHEDATAFRLLVRQFESPLVLILIFGACVSLALGQ